ncbi:hypothetical protein GJ496_001437 [Pomphorhynchus laevis]|nr:hypothetical protein GJ496_001437 [Pomphorhynchus laevis]
MISQLMRIQIPIARVIGRLSYSTIASYMRDSVSIDVKAAAGAISAITAIDFRLAQNLATNMLYGLTVVDNTMLYTKGWIICFLAFLKNLYSQAHPAHQINWPGPDGNFRFALWTADGTAEQFRNYVQTGRFIFTQINVPVQHYPILTHIARAGLTLGPVADQPCLRLSRIAWPAIPISVYGDQPWIQPDQWDVTANEIRAALIHMASQRHENLDLIMGFTRACNILGQTGIVINTQVAGGGDVARPVRARVAESAANRRVRGTGARRPSTARSRQRTTNATKSRSATVENSSDTEENGDTQPSNSPTEYPQDPSTTDGPQTVEYWWLATGELANLQMFFRPADYNVLWRLITASSRPDFTDNMRKELDVLDSANIEDLMGIAWGQDTMTIRSGTGVMYDWRDNCYTSPVWNRRDLDDAWWERISAIGIDRRPAIGIESVDHIYDHSMQPSILDNELPFGGWTQDNELGREANEDSHEENKRMKR